MNSNRDRSFLKACHTIQSPQSISKEQTFCLISSALFQPQIPAENQQENSLKDKDFGFAFLSQKQTSLRASLFHWSLKFNDDYLQLRIKTMDIGLRLFDYYCLKRLGQSRLQDNLCAHNHRVKIFDNKEENKELMLFCLFLAAKYNEIYPPTINDFFWQKSNRIRLPELLKIQKEILTVTNIGFTVSTASQWYGLLWNEALPDWGLFLYKKNPLAKSEHIARAVHFIVESTNGCELTNDIKIKMGEDLLEECRKLQTSTKGRNLRSISSQKRTSI